MEVETVAGIARVHAIERPEAVATSFNGRTTSYRELHERSNRVAQGLLTQGVGPQDRVAFLDKNGPEYFEILFGTAKLNAVLCAVNWRLSPEEAAYVLEDTEATVLFVGEEFVPLVENVRHRLSWLKEVVVIGGASGHDDYTFWRDRFEATDPEQAADRHDVCLQYYSSGTTGRPKGVMLTNDNFFSSIEANNAMLGFHDGCTSLVVMPLFHVAGGAWGLLGLYNGVANIILRDAAPSQVIDALADHRVTHTVLVPAVIQMLLDDPSIRAADLSSLELVVYGASPIAESVLRRAIERFGCGFVQAYGMTETTGGCVLLMPEDHDLDGPTTHRLRSAGQAGPGVELRIVDADTLQDLEVGGIGEIVVRSRQNMKGYWKMPQATADTILPDGWLRTGDAGYLDDDGYLYIHDRIKDMIISGGENIYPAEVENALMAHPSVTDVAVIGVPHERWGETPKALVVTADSELAEADVIAFARERLAHYKCPTSVEFVPVLPRNPSGKVLKHELRAPYWAGRTRAVN